MIPVIDGHNDLAWASREKRGYSALGLDGNVPDLHTDLPRLAAGDVGGQFWSVWVDPELTGAEQVTATLEQIDFVHRLVAAYPERLRFARTAADARAAIGEGKLASLIGVEGGAQIDNSLAVLRQYARLGARYMTLTWSRTIEWADSATDEERHGGLTAFGEDVVREMNRIGMLVDLAHVAPCTMRDALRVSTRPVVVSHSGALALTDHPRNVPDDVLRGIGEGDGVVMVAFVPSFVNQARRDWVAAGEVGRAPAVGVTDVADHVEHIARVAGHHAVGLGADYDGTDSMPDGLGDVSCYPALLDELRRRGWSEPHLEDLAYRNVLRVMEASDADHLAFMDGTAPAPAEAHLAPVRQLAPSQTLSALPKGEPADAASAADPAAPDASSPRVLVVINSVDSGPRRLTGWLEEEDLNLDVRVGAEGLPSTLDGYDGLVMLGGGLMPDEDNKAPWLAQERVLASEAIAADLPTLGICLGGQLLAHVGGGEVRAKFGPKERGATAILTSEAGAADAVLGALGASAHMIENHQDMITALPAEAVLLGSSAEVANQAFRLGKHVRGLQFHPEACAEDLLRWDDAALAGEGHSLQGLVETARTVDEENTTASRGMASGFAAEVRQRFAGRKEA
ncbi:hypothetical protein DWB68_14925 [Galactobacter valiniphilus]|uniref:Glutamine amidotransferase domain-containing protein n=1 Tax=Galactobacter valiniphilus TaxID=2676122 RepID=A0A399JEH9_9MICC|nr:membrane dipeptidase [Galactobacter valiniphilus]RII41006.1 hypothetical protein DWB68_14925 [Galactobacter valiniphilus]